MMQRLDYVLSRNLNSPFGKQDAFFETFVVPPEDFDTIPETNEIEKIKYTFVLCKSGVEVFDKYEKEEPAPKEFKVFYEEDSPDKSNFFGTACRVKMSKETRDFFIRISGKNQVVNFRGIIYDYLNLNGINEFVKTLAKEKNLNYTLLKGAIYLEIAEQSEINQIYKEIFSVNNKLADWMKGGIEAIEKWKFTDENYDFQRYYIDPMYNNLHNLGNPILFPKQEVKYKPIIPIPFPNPQYRAMSDTSSIVDKGLSKLSGFVESFEEISTAVVYNIVRATPDITDDIFFAIIFYVKNLIEDYIPESIKNVYNKLKIIFKKVLGSVKQIANLIKEKVGRELAKMNAFLCGIINGLISLGQLIILLLAMVVDNIPFLEDEKTSSLELLKHQEKLEFIEDFVDLFSEKSAEFFEAVENLFSDNKIWKGVSEFLSGLKKKFLSLNEYFWAYFLGAVVFELILDAVIAYFTGGASLVRKASEKMAQMAAKISRVTKQAEQLGVKGLNLSKNLGKKVATTADDLLKWLRKEFEELVEAIKGGEFSKYLRKKLYQLIGESPSQDELLAHWDEIAVSGRGRRLGQRLRKVDIEYLIKELKKLKVELQLHPLEGSFPIEGFFIREGVPAMMPERAAAIFITDGTKMKIVLREEATVYEFFHEFMHYKHSQALGLKKYLSLGGYGTTGEVVKEKWVYDKIIEHKDLMTKTELKHALGYLNDKPFGKNGIDPIDFDFDINKIPEVRKEIKIKEVLNKK